MTTFSTQIKQSCIESASLPRSHVPVIHTCIRLRPLAWHTFLFELCECESILRIIWQSRSPKASKGWTKVSYCCAAESGSCCLANLTTPFPPSPKHLEVLNPSVLTAVQLTLNGADTKYLHWPQLLCLHCLLLLLVRSESQSRLQHEEPTCRSRREEEKMHLRSPLKWANELESFVFWLNVHGSKCAELFFLNVWCSWPSCTFNITVIPWKNLPVWINGVKCMT